MHRVALGKEICNPVDIDGTAIVENTPTTPTQPTERLRDSMIALATNLDADLQPVSAETPRSLDTALLAMADTLDKIDHDGEPKAGFSDGKNYLVIGQYRALGDAEKVRLEHAGLDTKIRMVLYEGDLLYQVTAGPFNRLDAEGLEANFGKTAISTRVALSCGTGHSATVCGTDDSPAVASLSRY